MSETLSVTYYDRPLLKEPVWEIDIPIYYFLGGAAGAALVLGAAAQFEGGTGLSLVHDLGRPSRFLNMLRVFRPTSPIIGAWIS